MSKKIPIYFSDEAFSILQTIMGSEGSPSPTINHLLQNLICLDDHGFQPVQAKTTYAIPVALESIPTGFPSPAADYVDKTVDLNELLISNPISTFLNVIKSTSMVDAGLEVGDVVIIDRSKEPRHRSIVVALIDDKELTIKRLMITAQMPKSEIDEIFGPAAKEIPPTWLKAESKDYDNIYLKECQTFKVVAVVTWNLKNLVNQ
ncbi:LexA family protein [Acinetobacter cumulans]|uniref:LexA family protein n=1 Tax=Acinetobacter cumulans TaxID=2136182 RepID=UPI0014440DC9|nr:translesion error-prone DNA polymerase V autoproteolytic subunit [Acinetobacter cumulans]